MIYSASEWLGATRRVAGIMTGTSLDGIDIAIADFSLHNDKHHLNIIAFDTFPLEESFKDSLLRIIEHNISIGEVSEMNFRVVKEYQKAYFNLLESQGIDHQTVDAIGMHGQTVWHSPDSPHPSTLQLGSGSALSALTSKIVVHDFRSADVAINGQGAPLVPIFDLNFLSSDTESRTALNIGGISNLTYIPQTGSNENLIAFDTGPGNVWIDYSMKYLFGKKYDDYGETARNGRIIESLLDELKIIEFIYLKPPKSTGRELFTFQLLKHLIDKYIHVVKAEDIVASLTFFTAWSIAHNIKEFVSEFKTLIVSGGGSENLFLMEMLESFIPTINIHKSNDFGIPSDAKEAICFAYLAWLTLGNLNGNLVNVTGANKEMTLGSVSYSI